MSKKKYKIRLYWAVLLRWVYKNKESQNRNQEELQHLKDVVIID